MSKRASYREGIAWIAENDEPCDRDVESISSYISTMLLGDLFEKPSMDVAKAVLRYREAHDCPNCDWPNFRTRCYSCGHQKGDDYLTPPTDDYKSFTKHG